VCGDIFCRRSCRLDELGKAFSNSVNIRNSIVLAVQLIAFFLSVNRISVNIRNSVRRGMTKTRGS